MNEHQNYDRLEARIDQLRKWVEDNYLTRAVIDEKLRLVNAVIYGGLGVLLTAVAMSVISLILKR